MKKQLLCTSAIALGVAAAAPASAQSWDLDWGGYMNQHIAYADVSGSLGDNAANDFDGIGFLSNAEIFFTPSITLDNGLTFGVNVQLEADNQSGQSYIDETYMTISGDSFGRLVVGSENSAGYLSQVAAPQVTSMYINSPSISAFIPLSNVLPFNFRQAGISGYTEVGGNNDVDRLSYYTPNFNGLVVGVSYARNAGGNAVGSHNNNVGAGLEDIFDIGANYSGTVGGVDLNIGARWGTGDNTATAATTVTGPGPDGLNGTADDISLTTPGAVGAGDQETWGLGATVGFGGFTVGGGYAENDAGAVGGVGDQEGWSFGATFDAPGPWSFEALTYQGEFKGTGTGGADEDYEAYQIGAARDLGPGVSWNIYAVWAEGDDKGAAGTEVEGTVIGTAINLSF